MYTSKAFSDHLTDLVASVKLEPNALMTAARTKISLMAARGNSLLDEAKKTSSSENDAKDKTEGNDKLNGFEEFRLANGYYMGHYQNDEEHGLFSIKIGYQILTCLFVNGKANGFAEIVNEQNGTTKQASMVNGEFEGEGLYWEDKESEAERVFFKKGII